MYIRFKRLTAMLSATMVIVSLLPTVPVLAQGEYSETVLQGTAVTLPQALGEETVTWNADTTDVDTSFVGIQKFEGTTASGNVNYTLNVAKLCENELFTATMEEYDENTAPAYKASAALKYLNVAAGTATVQYDESKSNKVFKVQSGTSIVNVLYNFDNTVTTEPYGGYDGAYSVKGKIKLDLSSVNDYTKWNAKYPFNIVAGYGKQLTTNLGTNKGVLGGVGVRTYVQESTGKIKLFAAASTSYSDYSGAVSLTNDEWIEPDGWFGVDFELRYFDDRTFTVFVNGIKVAEKLDINSGYTKNIGINQLQIRNSNDNAAIFTIDDVVFSSVETATAVGLPTAITDTVAKNSDGNVTKKLTLSLSNGDSFTSNAYYTVDTSTAGVQTAEAKVDGFTDTIPVTVTVEQSDNERYVNITEGKTTTSKNNPSRAVKAVDGIVTANDSEYPPYSYLSRVQESGQWWQVDLGETMAVSAVKMVSSLATKEESMRNFEIRISDNESFDKYEVIASVGNTAYGIPGESFVRVLETPKNGRYIRVYKTSDEVFRIDEFKAYKAENTARTITPTAAATAFAVTGDVHSSSERFEAVMNKAYSLYPGLDAVVANGDLINDGTREELEAITAAIKNTVSGTDTQYILTRGNHDRNDDTMTAAEKDNMWTEVTGQEINQNVVVNNAVRFITIGNAAAGGYDQTAVEWLETQLAASAADTPDMPVFVCIHYPVASTFLSAEITDNNKVASFNDVLNKYPMVTVIGSHVHKPLYSEDNIWQNNNYTAVQTSALKGVIPSTLYTEAASDSSLAYCLFFEVDADGVVSIYRYDVANDEFIGEPYIYKPGDFATYKYTDDRELRSDAPAFQADAVITPVKTSSTTMEISFPGADDDEGVEAYRATVTNAEGEIVATAYTADKTKIYSSDADNTVIIGGLAPETTYSVSVRPVDYFHIWGEEITTDITTAKAVMDGNVALGKSVTASCNQDFAQYLTDGIIDGKKLDDNETYSWWKANSGIDTPSAVIDLGYECDIASVVLVTRKNSESAALHTANITLELSNDPTFAEGTYITLGTTPAEGVAYNTDYIVELDAKANYRYVRAIKYTGDNYVAIPEIEVYTKSNQLNPAITGLTVESGALKEIRLRTNTTTAYTTTLIISVYNEDGSLASVVVDDEYKPVRDSSEQQLLVSGVEIKENQYAGVMLWNNMNEITPQLDAKFSNE